MLCKLFILAFLATSFVQSGSELLETLRKLVQNAIKEAKRNLDKVREEIEDKAAEIAEKSRKEIEAIVAKFIEEMNKIKEKAKTKGIDIADCLKGREKDLLNLPLAFGQTAVTCVTNKVKEAVAIIDDAIRKVNDTANVVGELSEELKKCGTGVAALVCKAEVATKIGLAIANIPVKITTNVAQTVKLVATVKLAILQCEIDNVTQVGVSGQKIIEEITTCVAEKTPKYN